jgi:hypothetical protein
LFQVGTPEIAGEFMSTANYWSARLSKEPLFGGVSNIEYGWSEEIINTALLERPMSPPPGNTGAPGTAGAAGVGIPPVLIQNRAQGHMHTGSGGGTAPGMPRPSVASSIRGSIDANFGGRPKLPGDKVQLAEWHPPTQSMMASQLMEVDQLRGLTAYVTQVESELARHNELKHAIELAVSDSDVCVRFAPC